MRRSLKEATWAEDKAKVSRVRRIEGPWGWMGRSLEGVVSMILSVMVTVPERVLDLWRREGFSHQHSISMGSRSR